MNKMLVLEWRRIKMYEYEYCIDFVKLSEFLEKANENKYEIVSVIERKGFVIIYKRENQNLN